MDTQTAIGLVGFDHATQAKLDGFRRDNVPILLKKNCDVQVNMWTKNLEVVVKRYTEIVPSESKFNIENIDNIGATPISLSQLTNTAEFTKVNIKVKVIDVQSPQTTGKSLKKQEVTIADAYGNCILTLWEDHINCIKLEESYYITKLTVRFFNGDRTLSMPRTGFKLEQIEDIGNVNENTVDSSASTIQGAVVIGVKELQIFKSCLFCKAKIQEVNDRTGECTKCNTV